MEITTLKENGKVAEVETETDDFVDMGKKETVEDTAVIGIYDVKLKVGDGIRFGFGFGLGLIIWVLIFLAISFLATYLILMPLLNNYTTSVLR